MMARKRRDRPAIREDKTGRVYITCLPEALASPGAFASRRAAEIWLADRAEAISDLVKADRGTTRRCMCCQTRFESEGPHNRLCDGCRKRGSAEGEAVGYSFGAMTGRRKSA